MLDSGLEGFVGQKCWFGFGITTSLFVSSILIRLCLYQSIFIRLCLYQSSFILLDQVCIKVYSLDQVCIKIHPLVKDPSLSFDYCHLPS